MTDKHTAHTFDSPMANLDGKSILITGGTGSFGQAFTAAILERFSPKKLIIFSRDELKQFEMAQRFPPEKHPAVRFFIGDVRDRLRLEMAMQGVDYVIHAAAMKQVPISEYNPFECINTNVMGAENVVQAAIRADVDRVVALSTDKAANPVNLYGASKLASDKIFIAANNLSGEDKTSFSVVRYGNVLGSRGSVVPFFNRLIEEKADHLPITDPRMTRFWITMPQGINFVLSSLSMMRGGEIFIPKIPSMSMPQMATAMAPDIPQKTVGVRPGEKLHEIMITSDDARTTLELEDRYVIGPAFSFWSTAPYMFDGAKPVAEDFAYASDTNPEWMDGETLMALLAEKQD